MQQNFGFHFDNSYLGLPACFYTRLNPTPVSSPEVVMFNHDLSSEMGLDFSTIQAAEKAALFSGNTLVEGGGYFAQAYAGHQFGHFTMLGDGRAMMLGEHITPDNRRLDIQFKGAGRTPYARRGDGRAALGPMLREYIISEAMHYLGIPTTRSLAVVKTGENITRETVLPGAILTRVARSHLRIGTFEFARSQGGINTLKSLLDYTIARHYPDSIGVENKATAFLQAVMEQQADLVVHWMRVGFIHGVMNTDNMALSGETIDYGPCAFMDNYHPGTVFSAIDDRGRYAYQNQPAIVQWNLTKLAEALLPLIHHDTDHAIQIAQEVISQFPDMYEGKWLSMMRAKLGLLGQESDDVELINALLESMQAHHADYTNTFRELSQEHKPTGQYYESQSFNHWYKCWQARLQKNTQPLGDIVAKMKRVNPAVTPRNHKVEQAIEAAYMGDLQPTYQLLDALRYPYKDTARFEAYLSPPSPEERIYQTFCGT